MSSGHVKPCIFYYKIHTTKSAQPLGVKGLGLISTFWPIASENFKPYTQRIGLASRYKATLRNGAGMGCKTVTKVGPQR
jgi:hypothetical protein